MTPQEYLKFTRTTAARSTSGIGDEDWATYVRLGLISEVGEVAGQVKRIIRDDGGVLTDERREKLLDELGDVLWYWAQSVDVGGGQLARWAFPVEPGEGWSLRRSIAAVKSMRGAYDVDVVLDVATLAKLLGSTLEDVAARNVAKLSQRVTAGTIHGEGDER